LVDNRDVNNEQVTRFWSKLNLLAEISATLRSNPPVKDTFLMVLESIRAVLPFQGAVLQLFNKNAGRLEDIIKLGSIIIPTECIESELTDSYTDWVASHKKPVILSDVNIAKNLPDGTEQSYLVIPLIIDDRLIGILTIVGDNNEFFREKDIRMLGVVGDHLAVSIDRLIYQKRLEIKNTALKKARERLKQAQERLINDERLAAVRELAVSMNHEINNPLSVIIGNIQYLQTVEKNLSDMVVKRLHRVESEALRIADLNHRLLEIDELVSETYISGEEKVKMINLEKSTNRG
jgi:signal transduction histidine kinase